MSKWFFAAGILAALTVGGCGGSGGLESLKADLNDYKREVQKAQKDLREAKKEVDALSMEKTRLSRRITELEASKELAKATLENTGYEEHLDEYYIEFKGVVKNTGSRFLEYVTVALEVLDKNDVPMKVEYRNPPYEGSERLRKFFLVAGSLDKGKSVPIKGVRLETKKWHENSVQEVRDALKAGRYVLRLLYRGR